MTEHVIGVVMRVYANAGVFWCWRPTLEEASALAVVLAQNDVEKAMYYAFPVSDVPLRAKP